MNESKSHVASAFATLKGTLPSVATSDEGLHFKYAVRQDAVMIETRRGGVYSYWLLIGTEFVLAKQSRNGKLRNLHPVNEFLSIP